VRAVHDQFEALVLLFGEPNVPQTRTLYGKVANQLQEAHYSKDQIVRAGKLYERDHKDWAFTPTSLVKYIDQLLHVDRRPASSNVSREDDRPGISLLEYAMSDAGKNDPCLDERTKDTLRRVWKRSSRA
jgi:hypothetical protein